MKLAGRGDNVAGVIQLYSQGRAREMVWQLCMSRPNGSRVGGAALFFLRESSNHSGATVIITIKTPFGIMLN